MNSLLVSGIVIGTCFFLQNTLTVSAFPSASSKQNKTYRSDYEYNSNTDAFYKLHTELATHKIAKSVCNGEGAFLIVLSDTEDIAQAKTMMQSNHNTGSKLWISSTGLNYELDEKQDSEDCLVLDRQGNLNIAPCSRQYSFLCKVKAKNAPNNDVCKDYGPGYVYFPSVGSCYYVSQVLRNWQQARAECIAQDAHLVILNSLAEVEVVRDVMLAANKVDGQTVSLYFYSGIKAYHSNDGSEIKWKTVLDEPLQNVGFNGWDKGEPNNWHNDHEFCGGLSIARGRYNDINCNYRLQFVCEAEVLQI